MALQDQGGDFVFQAEVEMDLETSQVAAHDFVLPTDRQQRGATSRRTDRGGGHHIQADFAENPKTVTTARVAAREETTISRQQQGATSTEQSK